MRDGFLKILGKSCQRIGRSHELQCIFVIAVPLRGNGYDWGEGSIILYMQCGY